MAEKVIFLDVDGVLVHTRTVGKGIGKERLWRHLAKIDPRCMKRLARIIEETGASVVVSSTWRLGQHQMDALRKAFRMAGAPDRRSTIIGVTGVRNVGKGIILEDPRTQEISDWLSENGPVEKYVVIDDTPIHGHPQVHVKGGFHNQGLLDSHVEEAIALLRGTA
jgi:hypothetical protein